MADRHKLEIQGYGALLAEFCELADRVAAFEVELAALRQEVVQLRAEVNALLTPTWTAATSTALRYEIGAGGLVLRGADGD